MRRSLTHPGPAAPHRIRSVQADIARLTLRLPKGHSVNAAVTQALAEKGFTGGYVQLENVALEPLEYVIPAASPDGSHAAWYSGTHAPAGPAMIERAGAVAGERDGAPFIHCHGIWRLAGGRRCMGHLLPLSSILAEDVEVQAWGVAGAAFSVKDDPESGFQLFAPEAQAAPSRQQGARGFLCTVRPNEDISLAVETACRQHGFSSAVIHGIGSLVGADFADGSHVASYATEVLIARGGLRQTDDGPRCRLDVALVDMDGAVAEGQLVRLANPVCVTFELLVEEGPGAS